MSVVSLKSDLYSALVIAVMCQYHVTLDRDVQFLTYMGQVTKVGLSGYLVLLSFDSKTR